MQTALIGARCEHARRQHGEHQTSRVSGRDHLNKILSALCEFRALTPGKVSATHSRRHRVAFP